MKIQSAYITNDGLVRGANEDSLLINTQVISNISMNSVSHYDCSGSRAIFAVADGMGGHQKGEIASRLVIETLRSKIDGAVSKADVSEIISFARITLSEFSVTDVTTKGFGSTLAAILILGEKALIFNCGDSRVYRFTDRFLEKVSIDHSIVQGLFDNDEISEDEMRYHPQKNIVTSAILGDAAAVMPSIYMREIVLDKYAKFLLCSDGMWESMSIDDFESCFSGSSIDKGVECAFAGCMKAGARDNISIVGIEVFNE